MQRTTVAFSLSSTDHADLVRLLDETDARLTYAEMYNALTARNASGEFRMALACAEELLEWLRGRARAGRASSNIVELERALLLGRVALTVQRAQKKPGSVTR